MQPAPHRTEGSLPTLGRRARRLLAVVRDDRFEVAFGFLLLLGLRIGEALGLKWEDLDFERGTLSVRRSLLRTGGEWKVVDGKRKQVGTKLVFSPCKTDRSRRTLKMPGALVEALLRHRERQDQERYVAADGWKETGLVITNSIGGPLEPRVVGKRLDAALSALGLPHVKVHALRHTAATLLLGMGNSLAQVQQILGHSQIALTSDLYGHLVTDHTAAPLEGLGNLLAPSVAPQNPVAPSVAPPEHTKRPN